MCVYTGVAVHSVVVRVHAHMCVCVKGQTNPSVFRILPEGLGSPTNSREGENIFN